jgi:starvation-inducible outer membrane lipoprotein
VGDKYTNRDVISMKYLILLSILLLTACTTAPEVTSNVTSTDVMRLIEQTEVNAQKGVKGTFLLLIKATDVERRVVYLNTQLDYRDRRSITFALQPKTTAAFTKNVAHHLTCTLLMS